MKLNQNRINSIYMSDVPDIPKLSRENTFRIYPFELTAGYITSTENGMRNNGNTDLQDYSTFERVFTGLENIISRWEDSWNVSIDETTQIMTKTAKVGRILEGIILDDSGAAIFNKSTVDSTFLTQMTESNYNLIMDTDIKQEDLFKLFIIPTLGEEKWLYIDDAKRYFGPDKKFHHIEISLATLNDKIASSGNAIEQFVQRGAAGEGYTWPFTNSSDEIILDEIKLRDQPITSFQEEYSGPTAFNTIFCWGRPVKADTSTAGLTVPQFNPTIEAPRILLPYSIETPIPSKLNTRPNAEGNWYTGMFQPTLWENYKNWKDQLSASFNLSQRSQFEGLFEVEKKSSITDSNKIVDGTFDYILWNDAWAPELTKDFSTVANNMTSSEISLDGAYTLPQHFSHQVFATSYLEALPLQKEQNTTWRVSDFPIIGGFLSKFTAGVPIGWNNNAIKLKAEEVFLAMPTSIVQYGNAIMGNQSTADDVKLQIPMEIFTGKDKDDAIEYSGINATGSIMKVALTDRFSKVIGNNTFIFNTVDLGQRLPTRDENGNIVINLVTAATQKVEVNTGKGIVSSSKEPPQGFIVDESKDYTIGNTTHVISSDKRKVFWTGTANGQTIEEAEVSFIRNNAPKLLWDESCKPVAKTAPGFVIDSASSKTIGKIRYRRTFFANDTEVWSGTYQSRSLFTGSLRDWNNTMKISNWKTDDENEVINYPAKITDPKPPTINNTIFDFDVSGQAIVETEYNRALQHDKFAIYTAARGSSSSYPPIQSWTIAGEKGMKYYADKNNEHLDDSISTNDSVPYVEEVLIKSIDTSSRGGLTSFKNDYKTLQLTLELLSRETFKSKFRNVVRENQTISFDVDIQKLFDVGSIELPQSLFTRAVDEQRWIDNEAWIHSGEKLENIKIIGIKFKIKTNNNMLEIYANISYQTYKSNHAGSNDDSWRNQPTDHDGTLTKDMWFDVIQARAIPRPIAIK